MPTITIIIYTHTHAPQQSAANVQARARTPDRGFYITTDPLESTVQNGENNKQQSKRINTLFNQIPFNSYPQKTFCIYKQPEAAAVAGGWQNTRAEVIGKSFLRINATHPPLVWTLAETRMANESINQSPCLGYLFLFSILPSFLPHIDLSSVSSCKSYRSNKIIINIQSLICCAM